MRVWILAGFAVLLAGCTSESDLSPSDPMQPTNPDGGTVAPCARCFQDECAWEASECASDPGCAGWLTCARPCPADGDGNPSASCLDDCPDPGSTTGKTLRDVFVGCLQASAGCCGGSENNDGGAGGGAGGTSGGGGSGGASPDTDGGDAQTTEVCATDGCEGCLVAIKEQKNCATGDDACSSALSDCFHENDPEGPRHCWSYLTSYGRCSGSPSPVDQPCSYEVPKESLDLTSDGLSCVAAYCPQCIPDPQRQCVSCQLDACPDEMTAVMSSLDAQELLWCRAGCRANADQPACNQACFAKHEAGSAAVIELYVCAQSACKDACERG